MVQLIKKGGLRERANRSRKYVTSENSVKTLDPHRYATPTSLDVNATELSKNIPTKEIDKTDIND